MEKTVGAQPPADETTDREAAVKQIFEQMAQADARIQGYQAEIDQLKAETRAMLAQMSWRDAQNPESAKADFVPLLP